MRNTRKNRLKIYERVLHVLETCAQNSSDIYDENICIEVPTRTVTYKIFIRMNAVGLCYIFYHMGVNNLKIDTYHDRKKFRKSLPELYTVGMKHKCDFSDPYWFAFKGKAITCKEDHKYEARIAFMKEVIKECKSHL